MNGAELKEAVTTLPSYPEWSEKLARLDEAAAADLEAMRTSGRVEKTRLIHELAVAEEAFQKPHAVFMAEVAGAKYLLPLEYRLGVLSVFTSSDRRLLSENRRLSVLRDLLRRPLPWINDEVRAEDFYWPARNPYENAAQIGSVLEDTAKKVNKKHRPTPIAHLSVGRMRQDKSRPTIADYYLVPKGQKGLVLAEPVVIRSSEIPKVGHSIPPLNARPAEYSTRGSKIVVRTNSLYAYGSDGLAIPAIQQLKGRRTGSKLIFGKEAVKFARQEHAARTTSIVEHAARRIHPLERRLD